MMMLDEFQDLERGDVIKIVLKLILLQRQSPIVRQRVVKCTMNVDVEFRVRLRAQR